MGLLGSCGATTVRQQECAGPRRRGREAWVPPAAGPWEGAQEAPGSRDPGPARAQRSRINASPNLTEGLRVTSTPSLLGLSSSQHSAEHPAKAVGTLINQRENLQLTFVNQPKLGSTVEN